MFNKILIAFLIIITGYISTAVLVEAGILSFIVLLFSLIVLVQSLFTLIWMLYAWENPDEMNLHKSPKEFLSPKYKFSLLVPARYEEKVIADTLKAISKLNYPKEMYEAKILIREDDAGTIKNAQMALRGSEKENIEIITFNSYPINKPHSLNIGLKNAKNEIVGIFDAEDELHRDILQVINTTLIRENADVIQSGVQLMNYKTRWFSMLSVLEYFFWFKSGLLFFSKVGKTTPLGGNTVFIKTSWLKMVGGWDEGMLTEDADMGIRLSRYGAKTKVVYDELHTTREESPVDIKNFIRQRTRWDQGFLQILKKGDWAKLPTVRQRVFAFYILLSPFPQSILFAIAPILVMIAITQKLPVPITLFTFLPLYLFIIQILVQIVASYEFTKAYKLKFPILTPFKIFITFFPYQLLLLYSSIRSLYRILRSQYSWEKTSHENIHRAESKNLNLYEYST